MKIFKFFKLFFAIIGIIVLVIAISTYKKTSDFLKVAVKSQGKVVHLIESRSGSSSNNSTAFHPVVRFFDQNGNEVEFTSSSGSNPPSYYVGEEVEVLYNPASPNNAKINGFFSLWGGTLIFAIIGIVFTCVGGVGVYIDKKKRDKRLFLQQYGIKIQTDFQSVAQNKSYSVNGRHPYTITSQWQNPTTSTIHVFTSDNIWFDPTEYILTETIEVVIDRNNPKKYFMDLSFLPELSK